MIKTSLITVTMGLFLFAASPAESKFSASKKWHIVQTDTTKKKDSTGLKAGEQCPNITFVDTAGKDVSLSQFKGKYIYIDIWASWCYPCRKEYPMLAALRDRMKDKNIVFVGISCDTRDFRWKGSLHIEKMTGVQWMIKNEDFMAAFRVGTVPRYILLDKKGKIINPKMSRPSNPETEIALNALKKI